MRILLLVPFFSGSHRQWAEGLRAHSRHEIEWMTLPGRHWKWRMHGAAPSLARQLDDRPLPDLILTTDMLDVATFRGLLPAAYRYVPVAVYFHENQLSYPWSPTDEDPDLGRDRHYMWINYTSALAADAVFFNSAYHRASFLAALPGFLGAFPDEIPSGTVAEIEAKSRVLPLGLALEDLRVPEPVARTGPPVLLWNHRWEYDKDPATFFGWCAKLVEEEVDFRLIVLGDSFRQRPPIFASAKTAFAERILHWGFAPDRRAYAQLLARADLLPVTARQDFFGGSVVEAIYANTFPLLPDRLAYPEHLPETARAHHLYADAESGYRLLRAAIDRIDEIRGASFRHYVAQYDWSRLGPGYDAAFQEEVDG
jgi:glycosyltransferase involved in cell wall biosynthesis